MWIIEETPIPMSFGKWYETVGITERQSAVPSGSIPMSDDSGNAQWVQMRSDVEWVRNIQHYVPDSDTRVIPVQRHATHIDDIVPGKRGIYTEGGRLVKVIPMSWEPIYEDYGDHGDLPGYRRRIVGWREPAVRNPRRGWLRRAGRWILDRYDEEYDDRPSTIASDHSVREGC